VPSIIDENAKTCCSKPFWAYLDVQKEGDTKETKTAYHNLLKLVIFYNN
jgi:hypothetical protein